MRQRKLMLPSFHGERMQRYGDADAGGRRARDRRLAGRQAVPAPPRMQAITLEVILRAVFGVDEAERLARLRDACGRCSTSARTSSRCSASPSRRCAARSAQRVWRALPAPSRRGRRADLRGDPRRRARPANRRARRHPVDAAPGPRRGRQPMTDGELRDELMTLLVAGHETTATRWRGRSSGSLAHPDELARLRTRSPPASGRRVPRRGDQGDAAARPVVPGRRAQADRSRSSSAATSSGRDARRAVHLSHAPPPGRLSRARARSSPSASSSSRAGTYSWIPFGGGIRRCLGASFAMYEMKVVIPAILSRVEAEAVGPPEHIRRRAVTFAPARGRARPRHREAPAPAHG